MNQLGFIWDFFYCFGNKTKQWGEHPPSVFYSICSPGLRSNGWVLFFFRKLSKSGPINHPCGSLMGKILKSMSRFKINHNSLIIGALAEYNDLVLFDKSVKALKKPFANITFSGPFQLTGSICS